MILPFSSTRSVMWFAPEFDGRNVDFVLKMLDFVPQMLDFVSKMLDFVSKMLDYAPRQDTAWIFPKRLSKT